MILSVCVCVHGITYMIFRMNTITKGMLRIQVVQCYIYKWHAITHEYRCKRHVIYTSGIVLYTYKGHAITHEHYCKKACYTYK